MAEVAIIEFVRFPYVKRIKLRTLFIGGCITLFFLVLVARVFWIQVLQSESWQEKAAKQWAHESVIKAVRGTIEDRNGIVLASDVPAYTVVVDPAVIAELKIGEEVIQGLHDLLNKPVDQLKILVEAKDDKGNLLKNREVRTEGWKIDQEMKDKVDALSKSSARSMIFLKPASARSGSRGVIIPRKHLPRIFWVIPTETALP